MLIKDWRDWKNNLRRILGLGVFNFLLLFILGYPLFMDFITRITRRQLHMQSSRYEDISISGFTYYLSEQNIHWLSQYANLIGILILLIIATVILFLIAHLYKTKRNGFNPYLLLLCTTAALMIPSASFDYKLPILVAPMIIMLSSFPSTSNHYKKFVVALFTILISIAYWSTLYPYEVKTEFFARNSPALMTIFLVVTCLYFLFKGNYENIYLVSEKP